MDSAPTKAERFNKTHWQRQESRPSVYLEGQLIHWTIDLCPACGADAPGGEWPHGRTVRCGCSLYVLCFGLGLEIWRDESAAEKIKNKALQGLAGLLN